MGDWLSMSELQRLTGLSIRTIQDRAKNGEFAWRETQERGRNGKPLREYHAASLPPDIQLKLANLRALPASAPEQAIVISEQREIIPVASEISVPAPVSRTRAPITEADNKQIQYWIGVIRPLWDYLHNTTAKQAILLSNGRQPQNADELAADIAKSNGTSRATVWRKYSRFKKHGGQGLLDEARRDKGKSRFFATHPEIKAYTANKLLNERLSVAETHRALERDWPGASVSRETVRAFLKNIPKPLVDLALKGRRAYQNDNSPYISRSYEDVFSNEIWISDHVILDIEAQNDVFTDAEWGAPVRIRVTDIEDFRSRFIVAVSFSWEGSSRSIGNAIMNACSAYGPCEEFYCDNGKDYKKVGKGAMPAYLRESPIAPDEWYRKELDRLEELGVLAQVGMAVRYCLPFHPQSKHVERFHKTLHEHFCKLFPTYTGGRPDRRPDATTVRMAMHRKLQKLGMPEASDHPLASTVIAMCRQWIDEYNNRPMSKKVRGVNGLSPAQAFWKFRNPKQRPVVHKNEMMLLIAEKRRARVRECAIHFGKKRYVGINDAASACLHSLNGREVIVAFDPLELSELAILDGNGQLVCWARAEQLLPQSKAAQPVIATSMQFRRRLERGMRETLVALDETSRAMGFKTEYEGLQERTALHLAAAVGCANVVVQRAPHTSKSYTTSESAVPCAADTARQLLAMEDDQ